MNDSIIDLLRSFAMRHFPQRVCDFIDALSGWARGANVVGGAKHAGSSPRRQRPTLLLGGRMLSVPAPGSDPSLVGLVRYAPQSDRS